MGHIENPYLQHKDKEMLQQQTGLSQSQIQNWFMNVRKRIFQPIKKNNKSKGKWDLLLT